MWNYTEKVMDHFLHPRNVGEIADADAVGEVGNITCGDALTLYLKLDKDKKRITEAKFKTFGCASAIASSSVLTEIVKGMTLEDAGKITNKDIVKELGQLPEEKMHCSVMGMEALQAAIANFKGIKLEDAHDHEDHEGRIICRCFSVTDAKIRKVAKENNLRKAEDVTNYCKAGGACGTCLDDIQELLDGMWKEDKKAEAPSPESDNFAAMPIVQKVVRVQEVIDKEVRPLLEKDGGSIELMDIRDNVVKVRLKGRCAVCPASHATLKGTVQEKLREFVAKDITVESAD